MLVAENSNAISFFIAYGAWGADQDQRKRFTQAPPSYPPALSQRCCIFITKIQRFLIDSPSLSLVPYSGGARVVFWLPDTVCVKSVFDYKALSDEVVLNKLRSDGSRIFERAEDSPICDMHRKPYLDRMSGLAGTATVGHSSATVSSSSVNRLEAEFRLAHSSPPKTWSRKNRGWELGICLSS